MECTGENFFRFKGGKTAPLKFGLFDQFFSFLPKVAALVLTVIFSEKNRNHPTYKSDQSQDDAFLENFLTVRPET